MYWAYKQIKIPQDISTLAEAANYSLKASNIALQDHATLVQHDAQIAENSRRISSVERDVVVGANAAALAALKPIEYHEGQKLKLWRLLVLTKVKHLPR